VKLFRRKKSKPGSEESGIVCPRCGSHSTQSLSHDLNQDAGHVKVWRGQRFANYRCITCGTEFYADEATPNGPASNSDRMIEDEEELRAAEEELKRQTDAKDDRRFWPNG
jgi:DNA-directed RNA polymerase subunit RPC12/RpoP